MDAEATFSEGLSRRPKIQVSLLAVEKMNNKKILIFAVILLFVAAFFFFDLGQYLTLEYFKSQRDAISAYQAANPLQTALMFFLVYVAVKPNLMIFFAQRR